ncbi:MAG TPA: hypothetical protein VM577_21270 [Anaerovoracaceae bacterium]|nr:hypothetical protein [Anaerovoracaceae bacterium]
MVIPFPVPQTERYTIDYDPVSHIVDIPLVPDEPQDGMAILAVLIDVMIESGTLTPDEVMQIAAQAAGRT